MVQIDDQEIVCVSLQRILTSQCSNMPSKRSVCHPCLSHLSLSLCQIHSLTLLDQTDFNPLHSAQHHFLSSLYSHKLLSRSGNFVIPPNPKCAWYNPLILVPGTHASAGKGVYSLAPLMEVLGVEKFFLILSAILCEERILFIADDIDTVSSAVHAVTAMLSPFQWQHLFLPILPSSLLAYTSSPFPFIIGIRRYQFTEQLQRALSEVVVVDADSGSVQPSLSHLCLPDSASLSQGNVLSSERLTSRISLLARQLDLSHLPQAILQRQEWVL
jgi:hypothetical protein